MQTYKLPCLLKRCIIEIINGKTWINTINKRVSLFSLKKVKHHTIIIGNVDITCKRAIKKSTIASTASTSFLSFWYKSIQSDFAITSIVARSKLSVGNRYWGLLMMLVNCLIRVSTWLGETPTISRLSFTPKLMCPPLRLLKAQMVLQTLLLIAVRAFSTLL